MKRQISIPQSDRYPFKLSEVLDRMQDYPKIPAPYCY